MKMIPRLRLSGAGLMLCCAMLVGCGNSNNADQSKDTLAGLKALALRVGQIGHKSAKPNLDPAALASIRKILVQVGKPIYSVTIKKTNYAGMMTPYGQNRSVETWASGTPETVSLRDGILVATRGFGPDMMTATAPEASQVRNAAGGFHRVYYYLDGNDQAYSLAYDCHYTANGPETVTIIGQSYGTRRVTEDCESPVSKVQNTYWFDASGKLRQSDQYVSPHLANMRLQRVID